MYLLLPGDLGLRRQDLAEPLDDAADDLADAGLGDFVLLGLRPRRAADDVDGFVDFEVAFGGRELAGEFRGGLRHSEGIRGSGFWGGKA